MITDEKISSFLSGVGNECSLFQMYDLGFLHLH